MEYVGQSMVVDMRVADGNVYFESDHLLWKAKFDTKLDNKVEIKYQDIRDIKVDTSNEKRKVTIVLNNFKEIDFFLYRADEFVELINAGREANK